MKKLIVPLAAATAVAMAGFAYADEAKEKMVGAKMPTATANAPTVMTDAEMDKITAGQGFGNSTACNVGGTCDFPANNNQAWHANVPVSPGSGVNTR
jgi:hypothetical protein